MIKISTLAAALLAVSAGLASAQSAAPSPGPSLSMGLYAGGAFGSVGLQAHGVRPRF